METSGKGVPSMLNELFNTLNGEHFNYTCINSQLQHVTVPVIEDRFAIFIKFNELTQLWQ